VADTETFFIRNLLANISQWKKIPRMTADKENLQEYLQYSFEYSPVLRKKPDEPEWFSDNKKKFDIVQTTH
jgi:hypothetical protein